MPIQIPNQGTVSKLFEKIGGGNQLNLVGAVDFQTFLSSTENSAGSNSGYSLLEFAKTLDARSTASFAEIDLQLQADLESLELEAESVNVQAFQDQFIDNALWPVLAADEALTNTIVAELQNHVWQNAQYVPRQSLYHRQRARMGTGNHLSSQAMANKSPVVSSVGADTQTLPNEQLEKVDFVMVDPEPSLVPISKESGLVETVADLPIDGESSRDQAATLKTRLEVNSFSVDTPLPVQSEIAGLSVDGSMKAGLYSYVGAAAVQENVMTKQLLRQHLISQAANAIKTRYRQDGSKQTVSLELNPVELGHLKILIEQDGDNIQATIFASEAATTEILTDDHQQLMQKLRELNVGLADVEIVHASGSFNDETSQFESLDSELAANTAIRVGINLVA